MQVTSSNSVWDPIGQRSMSIIQDGMGGPTPGTIATSVAGVTVDLSELTTQGWVRMKNIDDTDSIDWGPERDFKLGPRHRKGFPFLE